jgi:hypothetical protein
MHSTQTNSYSTLTHLLPKSHRDGTWVRDDRVVMGGGRLMRLLFNVIFNHYLDI